MWCDQQMSKSPKHPTKPRFLQDGRLLTEEGWTLTSGPEYLSVHETRQTLRQPVRVLLHNYPRAEDITTDPKRIESLLADTDDEYDLFHHTVQLYSALIHRRW